MQLFILRHGQAELQLTSDEARRLTTRGQSDVAKQVIRVMDDLLSVEEIWASPLVRAQQTAQIARDHLAVKGNDLIIQTTEALVPEANALSLCDTFFSSNAASLLFVSHQPLVSEFLDLLCDKPAGFHMMDTSSIACVDCETLSRGGGQLRWVRHVNA